MRNTQKEGTIGLHNILVIPTIERKLCTGRNSILAFDSVDMAFLSILIMIRFIGNMYLSDSNIGNSYNNITLNSYSYNKVI